MKITPDLFAAFLKCPTKCWLRANGEPASGNTYAEWFKTQNDTYRETQSQRLVSEYPTGDAAASPAAERFVK